MWMLMAIAGLFGTFAVLFLDYVPTARQTASILFFTLMWTARGRYILAKRDLE